MTNDVYREQGLAIIQKVPTPITPVKINAENKTITLAYFEQKSTVDYIGVVQGIPVCFDAKETKLKSLPLTNIHEHQIAFMRDFEKNKGVAFLLVYFKLADEYYYLPFKDLEKYYLGFKNDGRKSIPYGDFEKKYIIKNKSGYLVHYLEALNVYISQELNENEEEP